MEKGNEINRISREKVDLELLLIGVSRERERRHSSIPQKARNILTTLERHH